MLHRIYSASPNQATNVAWTSLLAASVLIFWTLFPYAEYTTDDGAWILDALFRLQIHDWIQVTIRTSQGIGNSPLVAWVFALPLALSQSVTSVQIAVLVIQVATLWQIRALGRTLNLWGDGLLVGLCFLLSPALTLNYSLKLCNPSLIIFGSALLLRVALSKPNWSNRLLLGLVLLLAMQIHLSFLLLALPVLLARPLQRLMPPYILCGLGVALLVLLLLAALNLNLPHLRSFLDLVLVGSEYMPHRSLPPKEAAAAQMFLPWELLPAAVALIGLPRTLQSERLWIWLYFVVAALAAFGFGFYQPWSPHQWMLVLVLPFFLLVQIGYEMMFKVRRLRGVALTALLFYFLSLGLASFRTWQILAKTGGTSWHGTNLLTKRETLNFIKQNYPGADLHLAAPPNFWSASVYAWDSLLTLRDEHLFAIETKSDATLLIAEVGVQGARPASGKGWSQILVNKSIVLWKIPAAQGAMFPKIEPIRSRAQLHQGIFF